MSEDDGRELPAERVVTMTTAGPIRANAMVVHDPETGGVRDAGHSLTPSDHWGAPGDAGATSLDS